MSDVFLSYQRGDENVARLVASAIKSHGWTVFWDAHIRGGDRWDEKLQHELDSAKVVVVLWSTGSAASPWVKDEAAHGRDRGILVPISIDRSQPPLGFRQIQTISLINWDGSYGSPGFSEVVASLQRHLGRAVGSHVGYDVDIVHCIDCTQPMESHLDRVRKSALNFCQDLSQVLGHQQKVATSFRVKVLGFRSLHQSNLPPFVQSPFYQFPSETDRIAGFARELFPGGGRDGLNCGLEALRQAINAPWLVNQQRRRHVIVLWSATAPLMPGEHVGKPSDVSSKVARVGSIAELVNDWGSADALNQFGKRLIMFSPKCPGWDAVSKAMDQAFWVPSDAGRELSDADYSDILLATCQEA